MCISIYSGKRKPKMSQTKKRQRDDESACEAPTKRQKIADEIGMKLSNLDETCLTVIFQYLSIIDLVNLCEYDNCLEKAARPIFANKFGTDCIHISNRFDRNKEKSPYGIQLLKHFGKVIKKLHIEYDEYFRRIDRMIEDAIIAHCQDSLVEITFENADRFTMHEIAEPFEKVHSVTFISSQFCGLISSFSTWFPKAQTLNLRQQLRGEHKDRKMLENYHPALKHFRIENTSDNHPDDDINDGKVDNYNIVSFINMNPQLKSLSIVSDTCKCDEEPYDGSSDLDIDFNTDDECGLSLNSNNGSDFSSDIDSDFNLSFGSSSDSEADLDLESMKNILYNFDGIKIDRGILAVIQSELNDLQSLHFTLEQSSLWCSANPKIIFSNLNELSLQFHNADDLSKFPVSCKKIGTLVLTGSDLNNSCVKYVQENKNIEVLKLSGRWHLPQYAAGMLNMASKLPSLREIHFPYQHQDITSTEITNLLTNARHLKKFVINASNIKKGNRRTVYKELRDLMEKVPERWTADYKWFESRRYCLVFDKIPLICN